MDLEQMTHFQVCVIARKQEQALIDRDLALMEQTELADRCRKQAETLEAERDRLMIELRDVRLRCDNSEGMAECMSMFRSDMIRVGVIDEAVPPMFMSEAIYRAIGAKQVEIDRLRFELHEATESLVARMAAPQQHAQAAQGETGMLRDVLAIQEACGLHTDEYAPGSVIEYIKELEAENNPPAKKPISKEWCERMAKAEIEADVNIEAGNTQAACNFPLCKSESEQDAIATEVHAQIYGNAQAAQYADNGQQHEDPTGPNHPGQHEGHTCEAMGQMLADFGSQRTTPEAVVARMDAQAAKSAIATVDTPEFRAAYSDFTKGCFPRLVSFIDAWQRNATEQAVRVAEKEGYCAGYSAAKKEHAQSALSADQIEELMPDNEGDNGAFPCEKCGWIQVSAQWLHDFARNVHQASQQPAEAPKKTIYQVLNMGMWDEVSKEQYDRCNPDYRRIRLGDGPALMLTRPQLRAQWVAAAAPAIQQEDDDPTEEQWRVKCWESIRQHHALPDGIEQRIKASVLAIQQEGAALDEREKFETEMRKQYGEEHFVKRKTPFDGICYDSQSMNGAWSGWQARAALAAQAPAPVQPAQGDFVAWLWKRNLSNGGYTQEVFKNEWDAREYAKDGDTLPRPDLVIPLVTAESFSEKNDPMADAAMVEHIESVFQQGRAAGIEEAAKLADEIDGPISMRRLGEAIRALNKQEPTA